MRYFFVFLLSVFTISVTNAQVKLFSELPGKVAEAKQATLLKLNQSQMRSVLEKSPQELVLEIPFDGRTVTVELEKSNPFHESFQLNTDKGKAKDYKPGLYYSGKSGSFNFFDGELNGIFSLPGVGNLVVVPHQDNYVIYNDASLNILNDFHCSFEDPKPEEMQRLQSSTAKSATAKCITVYLEVDNQLHVNRGSNVTTTTNFVTSMFNNVKTLYANAGITLSLKSVFVWTTADPYTGTTSSAQLRLFHQYRPTFDANIGQLIAMDSGIKGGIADAIMGVCSTNKYSYVDVDPGFNAIPRYSWSVQGMAHEIGHLLGSPHTHACAWNGNNTPLDSCGQTAGYREGTCANGPTPTAGGSVMSYCHLVTGVGINFANGFGEQPTQRMLNTISGATCLSTSCTAVACTNGVGAITVGTQTSTSLGFTWADSSAATSWQVGVFTMAGSGTYSTVTSKSFTKTALTANTFYKIRIRPVCSTGEIVDYKEYIVATNPTSWCDATITDSGGSAGNYSANENYTRTIVPTTGTKARLTFSQFNLENTKDYLYVYNGSGTTSLIGTYTGTTLPAVINSTATNGALTIKFVSNASIQAAGFLLKVSCVAATVTIVPSPTAPVCTTNTTWNGTTWSNGVPSETKSAIINGNYTAGTAFTCCNLIINAGKTLTIQANKYIVVMNNITNNGTLNVQNNGQLFQVNDAGVNVGNGKFSRTTPNILKDVYVYWSSPTSNTTLATGLYGWYNHSTFKTANFIDVKTINAQGVTTANVADGIDDNNDVWVAENQANVMVKGKGYIARNPTAGIKTKDFVGVPTTGLVEVPLTNAGSTSNRNYNLVGNPYPSSISAKDVISANTGTTGVLYFWTHKSTPVGTAPGGVPGDYAGIGDFSAYSLAGGIASESGSAVPNGIIPSHQGFFVDKTTATNFVFRNSMRKTSMLNNNFLRQQQSDRYWLSLQNKNGLFRQTLISYDEETSKDEDWGYDAKMPSTRAQADFYSVVSDEAYLIQSRGNFDEKDEVLLGFTAETSGEFSIQLDNKEGAISDLYIKDLYTNKVQSLEHPFLFNSAKGVFNNRFVILYEKPIELNSEISEDFKVYPNPTDGIIHVSVPFNTYKVFDTAGRQIMNGKSGDIFISNLPSGVYLLQIDERVPVKVVRM